MRHLILTYLLLGIAVLLFGSCNRGITSGKTSEKDSIYSEERVQGESLDIFTKFVNPYPMRIPVTIGEWWGSLTADGRRRGGRIPMPTHTPNHTETARTKHRRETARHDGVAGESGCRQLTGHPLPLVRKSMAVLLGQSCAKISFPRGQGGGFAELCFRLAGRADFSRLNHWHRDDSGCRLAPRCAGIPNGLPPKSHSCAGCRGWSKAYG